MTANNAARAANGMTLADWLSLIGKTVRVTALCELFPEINGTACVIKTARRAKNGSIAVECDTWRKGAKRRITLDTGMKGLAVAVM